ncbi:hypothetical protein SEA_YEEZY_74 [Gordonia phage Yeezy]|uniref:Uncharacterized protein n=1 Tax=Gordonia phage Yeezy TaxID=1821565 RepID=A0A142K9N6_9CAUD|nr:hypothetical protein SEA_YEEZY_74 [Gordonia phage Yeezy]AMS02819.1 hypothetical protein SEA_YEEZY_74 [Gordonia phage Yeezy]
MTITRADALEVMSCVAACHPRTAPRWHDDPQAAQFTADTWARMFNRHNLELRDLLAAVERRAADTTDTAPEPGEIIQSARTVRRDRSDAEMATDEGRARRDAAIDAKVQRMISPLAAELGRFDRPALRAVHAPTREATGDDDARAQARAELDALRNRSDDGGAA